jgi:glycosyltransferase involved in cell wall biosynthesis
MQQVKVVIKHDRAREVLWNNLSLPTNTEVMVSFSDFLRLRKLFDIDIKSEFEYSYDPNHWREEKMFGLSGHAELKSGFGNCTVNLVRESIKKGYDVRWVGRQYDCPDFASLAHKEVPSDIAMVWHDQPRKEWFESPFKKNIAIVPFETTRIPESWVTRINAMDALFVPCAQNVQMMRDSGIIIPIEVVRWGFNDEWFYEIEKPQRNTYVFGTVGSLSIRKGTDLLIRAFQEAFPARQYPNVELLCKTSSNTYDFMVKEDKRIKVDMNAVNQSDLLNDFYKKIDCFVFSSRGEGFGLPPLESMATGTPTIVTNWSGPVEYANNDVAYMLDYEMTPASIFTNQLYKEDCGNWAEPNYNQLVSLLKYCYENQNEAKEKGKKAAKYAKENWTWNNKINEFIIALDKHL